LRSLTQLRHQTVRISANKDQQLDFNDTAKIKKTSESFWKTTLSMQKKFLNINYYYQMLFQQSVTRLKEKVNFTIFNPTQSKKN